MGVIQGSILGAIKGGTGSLDFGSYHLPFIHLPFSLPVDSPLFRPTGFLPI